MIVENDKDWALWADELMANRGLWLRDPTRQVNTWVDPENMTHHVRAEWVISDPPVDIVTFRVAAFKHKDNGPQVFKTLDDKEHVLRHMHYDMETKSFDMQESAIKMLRSTFMSVEQFVRFDHRPTWDEYFLKMAELASTRSVCERSRCGAVIVKNNNVVSTGYNGAPAYQKNCAEMGSCFRNANDIKSGMSPELCRAAGCHSESNAIALAAKHGHATKDATIYVYGNTEICTQCKGQIANAGITRVVYTNKNGRVDTIQVSDSWKIHPVDKK